MVPVCVCVCDANDVWFSVIAFSLGSLPDTFILFLYIVYRAAKLNEFKRTHRAQSKGIQSVNTRTGQNTERQKAER